LTIQSKLSKAISRRVATRAAAPRRILSVIRSQRGNLETAAGAEKSGA
jgi:hypothetical protein